MDILHGVLLVMLVIVIAILFIAETVGRRLGNNQEMIRSLSDADIVRLARLLVRIELVTRITMKVALVAFVVAAILRIAEAVGFL